MKLSVIVPMIDEEGAIAATLEALRVGAQAAEIIVVDGGSSDRSVELARTRCDRLSAGPRGRARQMNAGAALASGDAIAFVHADTIVPPTFARDIESALADRLVVGGRFDVAFDVRGPMLDLVATMISLRSRVARSATGDQAIFVRREVYLEPRWLCRPRALRGCRFRTPDATRGPYRVSAIARDHLIATMAPQRCGPDHPQDVGD